LTKPQAESQRWSPPDGYVVAVASTALSIDVGGVPVRFTSPDKLWFPDADLTKKDVLDYFLAVGPGILNALRDRPTTFERRPDGLAGESFFAKRVPKGAPEFVNSATVQFPSGRPAASVIVDQLAVVAWAVNLGTATFHPWPVRSTDTDHPDELRIDLDPQPGTAFGEAVVAAHLLSEVLTDLGWTGYPKTSGGRGLHVYVRIKPRWDFTQVRRALIAIGREMERREPNLITMSWWKEERGARIFIDFNQAARDRTIASAYSIRPFAHAPVSAPLTWDEVDAITPDDFTVKTMPERFAAIGDPHASLDEVSFDLTPALEWAARDEADGLGDLPYPPEFPKMPGEPLRVQPSRAKAQPGGGASPA
jgi:DNA ligase D